MATPFQVELVTPERVLYSGEAEEVTMRTDAGEIAFLANHEDFVGAVDISVCHLKGGTGEGEGESDRRFAVHGGFVYVAENTVTILASVAEAADDIDVERARAALTRAEQGTTDREGTTEHRAEGDQEHELDPGVQSPTMLALLSPEDPEVAARRAQVRLEAAGATSAS